MQAAEQSVTITLTEEQCDHLRWMLYDDLREISEGMAKDALAARDFDWNRSEFRDRYQSMQRSTLILDKIGWMRPGYEEDMARRRAEHEARVAERDDKDD